MALQQKLLNWYHKYCRDLPWRRTKDPYAIWISEIMLQQTTVETVIPYYEKFLKRFPTVASLALSNEEEVLRYWSGLGYYSRARNLHKAAQKIGRELNGRIPFSAQELITLPGIGRYTAGAIASIAFDQRAPILDGNVIRVLSRLFALSEDPKSKAGQKIFWTKAEEILPHKNCGDFNQALMELGATVCLPENPLCLLCPVTDSCQAHKKGDPSQFPGGRRKMNYRDVVMTAALVQRDGKVLVIQRPKSGHLKDMWEFPMVEGDISKLVATWPLQANEALPSIRHSIMNRRIRLTPIICELKQETVFEQKHRWILPKEIHEIPTSSMNRKIVKAYCGKEGGETIG